MSSTSPYDGVPEEELQALLDLEDHAQVETEEGSGDFYHPDFGCTACALENEIGLRRYYREAVKPGRCPASVRSFKSVPASDLRVGMVAQYLSKPGSSSYPHEWAEILSVSRTGKGRVKAAWRKTNSRKSPVFKATYRPEENVSIGEA